MKSRAVSKLHCSLRREMGYRKYLSVPLRTARKSRKIATELSRSDDDDVFGGSEDDSDSDVMVPQNKTASWMSDLAKLGWEDGDLDWENGVMDENDLVRVLKVERCPFVCCMISHGIHP